MSSDNEKLRQPLLPLVEPSSTMAPVDASEEKPKPRRRWNWPQILFLTYFAFRVVWDVDRYYLHRWWHTDDHDDAGATPEIAKGICAQVAPLRPVHPVTEQLKALYSATNFTERAALTLSGAVKIPTEVYDTYGQIGVDKRWEVFGDFHEYLRVTFPKVHQHLKLTKVNTYGLLYQWQGSDESLKPILFMAHQDVVPVDPAVYPQWQEPPYSGNYKEGWVWGRGSGDDKSGLIGVMLAAETLLEGGFQPQRTIVMSFGFDEEASGKVGAQSLAAYLKEYGPKEFAMIVDEGGGYDELFGTTFAMPATAEKGYIDARMIVNTVGGHSSVPPKHTSIGYLAALIAQIEANTPASVLTRDSPIFQTAECSAAHGSGISHKFRDAVFKASKGNDKALKQVKRMLTEGSFEPMLGAYFDSLLSTTHAVDIVSGGVKSNALPEEAFAIINNRIEIESSIKATQEALVSIVMPVIEKHGLQLVGFDGTTYGASNASVGKVTLSDAWGTALEPAPKSPTGPDSGPYRILSGSIRAAWLDANPGQGDIVVAPSMMTGNTDTRYYWDLSKHIFRYGHISSKHFKNGVHTINEALRVDGLVDLISFTTTLILNADAARDI